MSPLTEIDQLMGQLTHREKLILQWADNGLVMNHRLCEWCGHAPELEIEMGLANIGLDHLGQARLWLDLIVKNLKKRGFETDEDQLAYWREDHQFYNLLITEHPNGDFATTTTKMLLYDVYHQLLLAELVTCGDEGISAIAQKSKIEVDYHVKFSKLWFQTLSGGTEESISRMRSALRFLWDQVGEFFISAPHETSFAKTHSFDLDKVKARWLEELTPLVQSLQLDLNFQLDFHGSLGKKNRHTEHLSHLLAEMQTLARKHPGVIW